jgi:hypothetical protein
MYAPAKFITAIEPASGTPTTSAPTPVLEQEEEAQGGEGKEHRQGRERADACLEAVDERVEAVADRRARIVLGALGRVRIDAQVLEPALDLVGRVPEVAGQAAALAADAAEDQHAERHAEHEDKHEHQHRAGRARHPPVLQPADERREHRREDRGDRHWDDDRLRQRQQPDHADEQHGDTDQQPRRDAQVAQHVGAAKTPASAPGSISTSSGSSPPSRPPPLRRRRPRIRGLIGVGLGLLARVTWRSLRSLSSPLPLRRMPRGLQLHRQADRERRDPDQAAEEQRVAEPENDGPCGA